MYVHVIFGEMVTTVFKELFLLHIELTFEVLKLTV